MQTQEHRSHYSEIAAATADSPKQFGILRAVRKYNLAICQHNFRAEQIIERQTESRQQRSSPPPGHTHPPAAHGQPTTLRSSSTHRLLHISRALTEGKQRWPAINSAVENLPGPLAGSLTCDCNLALHYGAQVFCYRGP